jgi:hypothetical protein
MFTSILHASYHHISFYTNHLAFKAFNTKMRGYADNDGIILGVESRTSSPIRVVRNAETLQQWVNVNNKKILRTWFNGKLVDGSNLVKLA